MTKNLLNDNFSEPLNGATTAKFEIHTRDGNLTVERLTGGEQVLASGTLQYFESQGLPARSHISTDGEASLTIWGGENNQPRFRLPWATCNGATEWQIHLNPTIAADITARSGGGNVRLNLTGMLITRVSADTGGGNMDVVLPEEVANLSVTARTGAGNVVVDVPNGVAAHIQATTGLGKAIVDPRFDKIGDNTYQSHGYDEAANKVEIIAKSGAGNVIIQTP